MYLNWFQSVIIGFISGLTDILPVSAQAHRTIFCKLFGQGAEPAVLRLMIHIGTLAALYVCCSGHITRIRRQLQLVRIPKRRRKRPIDGRTLMDYRLLKTMLLPVILGFALYYKTSAINSSLAWCAVFLLVNAVVLFLPVIFPSGNKDARSMSPAEGLIMGLGGGLSVLPGISSVGAATSLGELCGADRSYALSISLLMHMAVTAFFIVFDVIHMITGGMDGFGFSVLLQCIMAGFAAFAGTFAGIRVLRSTVMNRGFDLFAWYSLGAALFSFILYLSV